MINIARIVGRVLVRLALGVTLVVVLTSSTGLSAPLAEAVGAAESTRLSSVARSLRVEHPLAPTSRAVEPSTGGPTVVGEEPQPPYTLGDDDRLDGLWVECEAGSGYACDRLFEESPLGSGYERFGVSCGERPHVLHCQVELDGQPARPLLSEWQLPDPALFGEQADLLQPYR